MKIGQKFSIRYWNYAGKTGFSHGRIAAFFESFDANPQVVVQFSDGEYKVFDRKFLQERADWGT